MDEVANSRLEIEKQGWRQASITGGEHLRRTLEMYKELDIEVYVEEVRPEECGGCIECYQAGKEKIFRIYTRTKNSK